MTSTQQLNILTLNCRGILSKLGEFKLMLYAQKPDIVCVQETWIGKYVLKFIGYIPVWKHRCICWGFRYNH